MQSRQSNGSNTSSATETKNVGDDRFHIHTSKAVRQQKESTNTTRSYRYAVIATIFNVVFLTIALVAGRHIIGRFMLVPVFFMMILMIVAQIIAHFNSTMWRTTTHSIEEYPDIEALITALSDEMRVERPTVTIYEKHEPHAKIMPLIGRSHNRLYLTTGLLEQFDDESLTAIIAHELAHIHHLDHFFRTFSAITQTTTMLTGTGIIFITFSNLQAFNNGPLSTFVDLPLGLTVGCLILIGGWVMNSQYIQVAEYLADTTAAHYTSSDAVKSMLLNVAPGDLDEAVVEPTPLFRSYPPMQTRISRMSSVEANNKPNQLKSDQD